LKFNLWDTLSNMLFMIRNDSYGVLNNWEAMIQLPDNILFAFLYEFCPSLVSSEKIVFFLNIFLTLQLSYFGFKRLAKLWGINSGNLTLTLVSVWYALNPYTLELWHGGAYSFGLTLTYSLMPLILSFLYETISSDVVDLKKVLKLALLLFVSTFVFWLFAAEIFFIFVYVFFMAIVRLRKIKIIAKRLVLLTVIYMALCSFIVYTIVEKYYHNIGFNNSVWVGTFGHQQGGLLYSLLMLFSWGIYTVWNPRALYSFGSYFFSPAYKLATIGIYSLVLGGFISSIKSKSLESNNCS